MSLFSKGLVEIVAFRCIIQLFVCVAVGFVTLKVWRHYCRNPYSFLHYIFLSFAVLLLHSSVKLSVYSLRLLHLPELPEAVVPMLDHALKMGWVILLLYAFIVTISGMRLTKQYFLVANLFLMVFISSTVWLNWLHYLDTTNHGQETFGFFWGELILETWILLLNMYGVFFARRLHTAIKGPFVLAVAILISRLALHCWNIITSHRQLIWTVAVDRMLLLLFTAVIMVAVFRYRKIVNSGNGHSNDYLQQDSGLALDTV